MRAMQSEPSPRSGIKRETAIFMILAAFVLGVVAGVALTIHKLGGPSPTQQAVPTVSAPPSSSSRPSSEQEDALRGLKARVQKDPNDVDAWVQLGNLYFDLDDPLEAVQAYDKALALEPGNPDVLTDQGIMYRRIRQPKKAVELFRKAYSADPNHFQSLYNLGVVLLHDLNDVPGAMQAWEEYLRVLPQGPHADRIRRILQKLKSEMRAEAGD